MLWRREKIKFYDSMCINRIMMITRSKTKETVEVEEVNVVGFTMVYNSERGKWPPAHDVWPA